jgi:hypothetical protein
LAVKKLPLALASGYIGAKKVGFSQNIVKRLSLNDSAKAES